MAGSSLPPGFRFHPTDEELVGYYLQRRNEGLEIELEVIPLIDLYKFDPWELPDKSFLPNRDKEWFFFCHRDRKYPNGSRANRATRSGYWKATGKDRRVICHQSSPVTGYKKTLVFYLGRAPLGSRTGWVMNEYRLCDDLSQGPNSFKGDFALCRVVKRDDQMQKKGEARSNTVPNEPFDISCGASYPAKESQSSSHAPCALSETGSPRIWASPEDLILESASKLYWKAEESASGQDLPNSTRFGYPEFFTDPSSISNFNWEMEASSEISPNNGFLNYPEFHMDGHVHYQL
ncbi:PREDICTED: NAC domain-containing protein 86 [Tarenaya hassleriana]|uniref:NAC domain-containing protein 86 n=1 Tax=Tarenaya hassleriana TaxID=28532 RepID=UPI00053C150C|nr:PREDICTED: NAC domain-containing protein 86 [Tarenaya hassleriana]